MLELFSYKRKSSKYFYNIGNLMIGQELQQMHA